MTLLSTQSRFLYLFIIFNLQASGSLSNESEKTPYDFEQQSRSVFQEGASIMNQSSLINKSCRSCQGNQPSLTLEAANQLLSEVGGRWHINDRGHLYNQFKFKNFMQAMDFANRAAEIAENEGHHPDLMISWGSCAVEIWTHKISGLSESDFILAAKIEAILAK